MKTVLATLAAALVAVPALASEPAFALRGASEAAQASTVAREAEAKPASGSAAASRKVRVVLASPYGN